MLVQLTKDEGEVSERPSESHLMPSPTYPSEDQHEPQPDPSLRPSTSTPIPDSNPEGSGGNHGGQSSSDRSLSGNEDDKGSDENGGSPYSTAQQQSIDKPVKGTDKPDEGTDKTSEGTDKTKVSTDGLVEGTVKDTDQTLGESAIPTAPTTTSTPTPTVLDVEDIERPRPTSTRLVLTLKPLPKIDPKAKGKGMIEEEDESDIESEDITKAEKKFKMLANDEELAKKARLNVDNILAEKLQEEERSLYEKIMRSDESFIVIGSGKDERLIKQMNKQVVDPSNKKVKKDNSIKEESKQKEGSTKKKLGTRKKMKSRKRRFRQETSEGDSDVERENKELRLCLTIATDKDKELDYEVLDKKYPIIEWKCEFIRIKPQYDETKELEEIDLNVVTRSNGQFFSNPKDRLQI
ncbi:hypothetical protein Tco_0523252 [Tanacetum coccineum]